MADHVIDETSVVFVQDSCGVNRERAVELLEAGSGSVERAVEIHFQAAATGDASSSNHSNKKRKASSSPLSSSPSKQASLVSFFGKKNGQTPSASKQRNDEKDTPASAEKKKALADSDPPRKKAAASLKSPDTTASAEKKTAPADSDPPRKKPATSSLKSPDTTVDTDPRLHYGALAEAFGEMVATTKRLQKLAALQKALMGIVTALGGIHDNADRSTDAHVLCCALELILGTMTLQVSGSAVSKAVTTVTGASSTQLRQAYRKTGDLGDAAEQFMRNQRLLVEPKPLTIVGVYDTLQQVALQEGKGSQNQRHAFMVKLLRSCKSREIKFLVRTLLGNMRLGANIRTVLAALAATMDELQASQEGRAANTPAAVKTVQDTFDFCPRLDKLSHALLCGGVARMKETCVMEVGTPINLMLANPAHSLDDVEKLMTCSSGDHKTVSRAAVAEWKYDGMRCQAHYDGSTMKLFSRHMLETTDQFPDSVQAISKARKDSATSFIIDSEIVGVEESAEEPGIFRLLPFQDLSTRRGADATENGIAVRIRVYVFDIMFLNGESLAKKPLLQRQELLKEHFTETVDFCFAQSMTLSTYDESVVSDFLETAVKGGAEGLMVKLTGQEQFNGKKKTAPAQEAKATDATPRCPYESGVRSQTWLKVKRDYVSGFSDSIDVVPIGAWYGNGRKAQKKFLSPVLFAVYDEEEDVYRSISRCMSFTDAMYEAMRNFYLHGIPYPDGVGMGEDEAKAQDSNENAELGPIKEAVTENDDEKPDGDTENDKGHCYTSRPSALVVTNESPPIWFKPMEVFEVSFADLSLSKTHTAAAGLVDAERGVALRFPRFKRRRPDKRIDQATTSREIAELFGKQTKQGKS